MAMVHANLIVAIIYLAQTEFPLLSHNLILTNTHTRTLYYNQS